MNKKEFVEVLSKKTKLSKRNCELFLDEFKNCVLEVCGKGQSVSIRDFGKFSLIERKPRKFLNPQTKRFYIRPAKKVVVFKGYKNFAEFVR